MIDGHAHIVIYCSFRNGFEFYGPFDSVDEVKKFMGGDHKFIAISVPIPTELLTNNRYYSYSLNLESYKLAAFLGSVLKGFKPCGLFKSKNAAYKAIKRNATPNQIKNKDYFIVSLK